MSQDKTVVVMGSTRSNIKDVECFNVDPASFPAGFCVSLASTGLPSLLKSAGMRIGVSLGKSLSDHKKTDVARTGLRVPVRASLKRSTGVVTISSYANLLTTTPDSITIGATLFVAQAGAATPGTATFRAATSNAATATSLATQINAHATANTLVYAVDNGDGTVSLFSKVEGAGAGNDVAVAYTDNGGGNIGATLSGLSGGKLAGGSNTASDIAYAVVGAKMYINDVTGAADIAMIGSSTVSDAMYVDPDGVGSPIRTGIDEDGNSVTAVLVDMQGSI